MTRKPLGIPLKVSGPPAVVIREGDPDYERFNFRLSPEAVREIEAIEHEMRMSARRLRDIWVD